MAAGCFHCGDDLPAGEAFAAELAGGSRPVCCIGCKAVAEFIEAQGMSAYYRHRETPAGGSRPVANEFAHYDLDEVRARFVALRGGNAEVAIDVGGLYCSACSWLLRRALERLPAVCAVDINPTAKRVLVAFDGNALTLGNLLAAIARVGFAPRPVDYAAARDAGHDEYRAALKRLIVSAAAGMQVMMFAIALYAGDHFGIEGSIERFLRGVSLLAALPIVAYSARPFYAGALRGLQSGRPGMDVPVTLAIGIAFSASVIAVWRGEGDIYFDSVAMFVLFLGATRFLEMRARQRGDDRARALRELLPEIARRATTDGVSEEVAVDELKEGDRLRLLPGDVVPADARVIEGRLAIDESLMTGESVAVQRRAGDETLAGTVVRGGSAVVEVLRCGAASSIAEVGRLIDRAQADRPPLVVLADRIAVRFVVGVLLLAAATTAAWLYTAPERALEVVLATLVVTCPCALALATPAALAAASTRLATRGLFVVRARLLELLQPGTTVVFDKTGTLTRGVPEIVATEILAGHDGMDAPACRQLAAAMETASEHVLARAFAPWFAPGVYELDDVDPAAGNGVEALLDGEPWRLGRHDWVAALSGAAAVPVAEGDGTRVYLGNRQGMQAVFCVRDALRADAGEVVRALVARGMHVAILSGDRAAAVSAAAGALEIDDWQAELTPAGKLTEVTRRQQRGERVVMVGDGVNDAPVLAAADASVAMDAGTALARASADGIIAGSRLAPLIEALDTAALTRRIVRQNLAWAIGYNLAAVPLAASGVLAPWMAALGMSLSSLLVVGNALRLRHRQSADTRFVHARERTA